MTNMRNSIKLILILILSLSISVSNAASKVQIALLLDTSNSMDGLIDQAKGKLWAIVNELSQCKKNGEEAEIEIALYEYGNDRLIEKEYWIRQVLPFTNDLDNLSERLFKLRTKGGNEYCGAVIAKSLKDLSWSTDKENLKMIIIAGNESFSQGPVSYEKTIEKAVKKDIIVHTIYCGDYETGVNLFWKEGAELGNGNYSNIDQEQSIDYIATPYDEEIFQLNKKLNTTYVAYGSKGKISKLRQEIEDSNAESFSMSNAVDRAVSKASYVYKSGDWDLVDAYVGNKDLLKNIKQEDLPSDLKNKSNKEIESFILSKNAERKAIQNQILELQEKRIEYLKEQKRKGVELTLEEAFMLSVRETAISKGFTLPE